MSQTPPAPSNAPSVPLSEPLKHQARQWQPSGSKSSTFPARTQSQALPEHGETPEEETSPTLRNSSPVDRKDQPVSVAPSLPGVPPKSKFRDKGLSPSDSSTVEADCLGVGLPTLEGSSALVGFQSITSPGTGKAEEGKDAMSVSGRSSEPLPKGSV